MKRSFRSIIAILLCIFMIVPMFLTSCGGKSSGDNNANMSTENKSEKVIESDKQADDGNIDSGSTENGSDTNGSTTVVAVEITLDKSDLSMVKGDNQPALR